MFMLLLLSSAAIAGGPFVVDMVNRTGVAQRWQNDALEWYVDAGPLSIQISNAVARQWIGEQLNKWTAVKIKNADLTDVSTAIINASYKGTVGEDIDETNYGSYISAEMGPTVIIFDEDGDITAALVGEQNRQVVVGLSQPLLSDSSGLHIVKGFAMFNGLLQSNGVLSPDQDTANELFKATILHELGHLLNLDHSQVNFDIAQACERNGICENGNYIPTMYPELLTPTQGELARDDKVTLSWIYPTAAFEQDFCTITGEIFDASGQPLKGVNVLAHRVGEGDTMAMVDARAFVSGVLYPGCHGDSRYYLHGIVPGKQYQVTYEPIGSQFTGASDFEPLGGDSPRGFEAGTIDSPSGETTVGCDQGGQTIQMASLTLDVSNPCVEAPDEKEEEVEAKAGCAMMSGGGGEEAGPVALVFLFLAATALAVRRHLHVCRAGDLS